MKVVYEEPKFTEPFTYKRLLTKLLVFTAIAGVFAICTEKTRANLPYYYLAGSAIGTVIRKGFYEKQRRKGMLTFLTEKS